MCTRKMEPTWRLIEKKLKHNDKTQINQEIKEELVSLGVLVVGTWEQMWKLGA